MTAPGAGLLLCLFGAGLLLCLSGAGLLPHPHALQ